MSRAALLAVLLAVVFAALYAAIYMYTSSAPPSGATPTPTVATAPPEKCGEVENAIIEVYNTSRFPEYVVERVVKSLSQYFPPDSRPVFCTLPWNHSMLRGRVLRLYPSIVVKASSLPKALEEFVAERIGGDLYVLSYSATAQLAVSSGVPLEFTKSAEAILVNGTTPYSSIPLLSSSSRKSLVLFLEVLAAARITRVSIALASEYPWLGTYPSVVLHSSEDLAKGVPHLVREHGVYVVNRSLAVQLASVLGEIVGRRVFAEVREEPPLVGVELSHGPPRVVVGLYLDAHCPYCARLVTESLPRIMDLYEKGEVSLVVSLGVGGGDAETQAAVQCYYAVTRNATGYLELLRRVFQFLLQNHKQVGLSDVLAMARGLSPGRAGDVEACVKSEGLAMVSRAAQAFREINSGGTPTIVLWNPSRKRGLVIVGFVTGDELRRAVLYVEGGR